MTVSLHKYFEVEYGTNNELITLEKDPRGVAFVSRTSMNNGVSARVKRLDEQEPNPANTISVSCGGSVMESFLQKEEYYSGRDVYILKPKIKLTEKQLLFYCMCLKENKYKYNYGRQANKTLREITIPSLDEIPSWVNTFEFPQPPKKEPLSQEAISLHTNTWKYFRYDEIFDIKKGYYNKKPPESENGQIPFIGATERNNGITSHHTQEEIAANGRNGESERADKKRIFDGNCITISNNGSVGYAFYQPSRFTCSHDVNPVYLKQKKLNVFIAMFLCAVIGLEKYRWNYGRKWRPKRMPSSLIKLPVDNAGNPAWQLMENFIKTLQYSQAITN
jgi:hypothetical protein